MRVTSPFLPQHKQIKPLYLVSGPGGLAQKLEARFDARVMGEAPNGYALAKLLPPKISLQLANNGLKCEAMERVTRRRRSFSIARFSEDEFWTQLASLHSWVGSGNRLAWLS